MIANLSIKTLKQPSLYLILKNQCAKQKQVQLTFQNAQIIIDKLVKNNKICLFMKGSPQSPACGYSHDVVQLLKRYGMFDFKYVNVLENEIFRDQVKVYSKWPTYPQLYINGQFIGGSDILNQMHKEHSFIKLLQQKKLV